MADKDRRYFKAVSSGRFAFYRRKPRRGENVLQVRVNRLPGELLRYFGGARAVSKIPQCGTNDKVCITHSARDDVDGCTNPCEKASVRDKKNRGKGAWNLGISEERRHIS
jgi:hypothetical protein